MRKIIPNKIEERESLVGPSREIYPHFNIDLKHLPEAKEWKIGNKYCVLLELKQTDMSVHSNEEKMDGYVGFEIVGIEVTKKKSGYKELPDKE